MATPTLKPANTTMAERISELSEKREKLQLGRRQTTTPKAA